MRSPLTLIFDNITAFNDYFLEFKYGKNLSFDVMLFGPALSTPNGAATSGSTFAFSMFSDAAGTGPTLTTDQINGLAFAINVNLDGTTAVSSFSPETSVGAAAVVVPEPNLIVPTASALPLFVLWHRKRCA